MPNGRVHHRVGRPVGAAYATFKASQSPIGDPFVEGLAGYFGGGHGAVCPDWLEPARWNHRQTAHSFAVGGLLVRSADEVQRWAESCRHRARRHQLLSRDARLSGVEQFWHSLVAIFWSAVAGWLNGFVAGYLSHLVLNSRTPSGIPVV